MTPKKALCIHDMSSIGRCSLTVVSPVLSVMGIQCVPMATMVLSTHFGGFGAVASQELTSFCNDSLAHFKRLNIDFDCVYSGYLFGCQQIETVKECFLYAKNSLKICDPVMADNGKIYSAVDKELIDNFKILCSYSDLITPNSTEAQLLLDKDYSKTIFSYAQAQDMAQMLSKKYDCSVIITGVKLCDGRVICAGYNKEIEKNFDVVCNYLPVHFPGTGDLFGAVLVGNLLKNISLDKSCVNAARFVELCVTKTYEENADTRFGVHLEPLLKYLIKEENYNEKQ